MLVKQVADLGTVLAFQDADESLLGVLLLVLVDGASLLQLLQGYLKLLLRFNQVLLVCLLLLLEEVALALPEGLLSIIVALHIEQLLLKLLHLPAQLHDILCVRCIAIVEGGPCGRVQGVQLILQLRHLVLVRLLLPPLLLLEAVDGGLQKRHLFFEVGVGPRERLLNLLQRLPLLLVLVLPELLLRGYALDLRLGLVLHIRLEHLFKPESD